MNMENNGRFYVSGIDKNGKRRKFCVEPIDNSGGKDRRTWGDVDPATGSVSGKYGNKHSGSVKDSESVITPENGYKNIIELPKGHSPMSYINSILKSGIEVTPA